MTKITLEYPGLISTTLIARIYYSNFSFESVHSGEESDVPPVKSDLPSTPWFSSWLPMSLFLLVLIRLVPPFASVANGVLLHAVDLCFHLGAASSSEHKKNHIASDHGRHRTKEVNCDTVGHLCNRWTDILSFAQFFRTVSTTVSLNVSKNFYIATLHLLSNK
jgi:hypothetical protein